MSDDILVHFDSMGETVHREDRAFDLGPHFLQHPPVLAFS